MIRQDKNSRTQLLLVICSICFFAMSQLVSAAPMKSETNGQDTLIYGGTPALPNEFPWVVALTEYDEHFCGGSLIASEWILTAAHCVDDKTPESIKALVGQNILSEATTHIDIEKIVIHSEYDPLFSHHDIALIKLKTASSSQIIDYVGQQQENDLGETIVMGWGELDTGEYPDQLYKASLPLVDTEFCRELVHDNSDLDEIITDKQLCFELVNVGTCTGDSGGPFVTRNQDTASWVQIGIVSYGTSDDCGKEYDVAIRTNQYQSWVENVISGEITGVMADKFEPNNTSDLPTILDATATYTNSIYPMGDVDWFSFSITETSEVILNLSGFRGDTEIVLYNDQLVELDYNDDALITLSMIYRPCDGRELTPGTYFAKVFGYNDSFLVDRYVIKPQITPCSLAKDITEPNDNFASAIPLLSGSSAIHALETGKDKDVFVITVSLTSSIEIVTESVGDTIISINDTDGKELVKNDDSGVRLNGRIVYTCLADEALSPGTYYLTVEGYNSVPIPTYRVSYDSMSCEQNATYISAGKISVIVGNYSIIWIVIAFTILIIVSGYLKLFNRKI